MRNGIRGALSGIVLALGSAAVLLGVSNISWSIAVTTCAISVVVVLIANFLLLEPVEAGFVTGGATRLSGSSTAGTARRLGPTGRLHVYWACTVFFLSSAPLRCLGFQAVAAGVIGVLTLVGVVWAARSERPGRTERLLIAWVATFLGCLWLASWVRVIAPSWLETPLRNLR